MNLQQIAATVHRSVLLELSTRHAEIVQEVPALIHGIKRNPRIMADIWVDTELRKLQAAKHHKAYDEQAIRDYAENYARICERLPTLARKQECAAQAGIPIAEVFTAKMSAAGRAKRLGDAQWWRGQLRKLWTRQSDDVLREIGMIRRRKQPYVSDAAVEHRAARNARTRKWLESREMVSDNGDALDLVKLHHQSMANPAIRRGEFMCRMRGFGEFADGAGHVALFWTLTTPSRFHAQLHHGGVNPNWQTGRAKVRDGQKWLCKTWARGRSMLHRRGIEIYGGRVAEPHHDGTPHWHALLWVPAQHAETVREELRALWLEDGGDEPGAQQRRTTCIEIDKSKGSAIGYIAKYIAKNLDGAGQSADIVSDETGEKIGAYDNPKSDVHRVAAWASVHGIRQFQQIGGPPVGLWRELRRLRNPVAALLLESIRVPTDEGSFRNFIESLGGITRARRRAGSLRSKYSRTVKVPKVRALRLAVKQWRKKCGPRVAWHMRPARPDEMPAAWVDRAEPRAIDVAGRDCLMVTRYGEVPVPRAAGVCSYGLLGRYQVAETRPHRWRIEKKCAMPQSDTCFTGSALPDGCGPYMHSLPSCGYSDKPKAESEGLTLDSRSDLGPVAITVRNSGSSEIEASELSMTVPYRDRVYEGPVGKFIGPPRPLAWVGKFIGPPDPRNRVGHIRSEAEFQRLAWQLLNAVPPAATGYARSGH